MPEGVAPSAFFRRRGVYPVRKQFVPRLRSMPSALPIYRRRSSSSGDAGRGRRPFRSLPQAGACTPLGNNLSPVCGQCRRRFRFTATVPLPPGCRKGPPPLPFSSAGGACTPPRSDFLFVRTQRLAVLFHFIRSENFCRRKIASDLPPPFLFLRGCPPLPLSSAGGGVYPARRQFVPRLRSMPSALPIYHRRSSSSGDAGRDRRPFRFLSQAGACTPPGNNLSPVSSQCRRRFRFTAAAPSALFRRRGRVPR